MRRGIRRHRSGGLCAALAVAGWVGSSPAWAVSGADPGPSPAGAVTVEALEARVQALSQYRGELAPVMSELRQIEAGFVNLLDRQPEESRLLADLGHFYRSWGNLLDTASPAALRLVTAAADPIHLAWRLHFGAGDLGADLLFAALSQKPAEPDVWLEAGDNAGNPAWKIVAAEEGARLLARRDEPAARKLAAAAVESALELDVEYGQLDRAAATLASLPAAVRAEVESGAEGSLVSELDGANLERKLKDVRLDLALLSVARGDLASADRWLAAVRSGAPRDAQPGGVQSESAWYRLLEAWRRSSDDPFDALTSLVEAGGVRGGRNLAPAAVARRGGYPTLEARFAGSAISHLEDLAPPAGERKVAPRGAAAAAAALEAAIGEVRSHLVEAFLRSTEEARAALGPDPAAAAVERLLRSPLLVPFVERPLPAGVAPLTPYEVHPRSYADTAQVQLSPDLAKRFEVVRAERSGRQVVVIASATGYSAARYWVILSSDGGTTWSQPFFAGLRVSQNYTVPAGSNLPLLAGDHLHLEVERRVAKPAAESSAAGTAPAAAQLGRGAQAIYLDIPLATLQRDSDGDGLTDLAEECLVTDPADPDTDHDGVPDGVDPLPQAASRPVPGPESLALAAFFAAKGWNDRVGIGWPAPLDVGMQTWIADRQLFAALHPLTRMVVFTPEELDLAEEKLGPLFVRYMELFVLDHAGRRGLAIWTSPVQGETWRFERETGPWRFTMVDSWNY
jgi:hypothetical protein